MVCLKIVGSLALSLTAFSLCGCGTVVPNIKEAWDSDIPESKDSKGNLIQPVPGAGQIEFEIKRSVFCELRDAVYTINHYQQQKTGEPVKPALPNDWTTLVSLSLEVDESSSLNPGVALNVPMANAMAAFGVVDKTPITTSTPQAFSLGFGATLSSTATRIDKFDPSWTIHFLSQQPPTHDYICDPEHDVIRINAEKNNG